MWYQFIGIIPRSGRIFRAVVIAGRLALSRTELCFITYLWLYRHTGVPGGVQLATIYNYRN
jgi:hypothetical protein